MNACAHWIPPYIYVARSLGCLFVIDRFHPLAPPPTPAKTLTDAIRIAIAIGAWWKRNGHRWEEIHCGGPGKPDYWPDCPPPVAGKERRADGALRWSCSNHEAAKRAAAPEAGR